jgi:hypothetical protein
MIVERGPDRVGEWFFSSRDILPPLSSEREAFDWTIAQLEQVLLVLGRARLLEPTQLEIRLSVTRPTGAPERYRSPMSTWDEARRLLHRLSTEWPNVIPVRVDVYGNGVVLDAGAERVLPDVVGVSTFSVRTKGSVVIKTWCDAWLPLSLRGEEQPEIYRLNAPRLRSALEEVERVVGAAGGCDGATKFSRCEGYELRNQVDSAGNPFDMFEADCDESIIIVE